MHPVLRIGSSARSTRTRIAVGAMVALATLVATACSGTPSSTSTTRSFAGTTTTTVPSPSVPATSTGAVSTTTTVVGPPGGPAPAAFAATSFTATSLSTWWMLGTADCLTGTGTCSAVVRTTDGGASFDGIPGPPVGPGAVSQLRFASALDGYAFGPGLWQTTTGGSSWTDVSVPGQVSELEAAGGEAYLLTTGLNRPEFSGDSAVWFSHAASG